MRTALPTLALVIALSGASPAAAYNLKLSDAGLPLRWPTGVVEYHIDPRGGAPVPEAAFTEAIDAAFATWGGLEGGQLTLERGAAAPDGFGYDAAATNASVVRYAADEWDYDPEALMLTFVSYRVSDGAIVDADILINGVDHRWTAGDASGAGGDTFDLQNSLTHEAGHFLGLAHSPAHPEAAMYPTTAPGEVSKRTLAADDAAGFTYLYVEDPLPGDGAGDAVGCAVGRGRPGTATALALLLALVALRAWRRLRVAALVGAVLLPAAGVHATTLRYLSLTDLARTADVVVQGRVTATRAYRSGRMIFTATTVKVDRCLRGPCGAELTVHQPGGEVDGVGLHVEGAFRAATGEELVLFVRRGRDGRLAPVGMTEGALRVRRAARQAPMTVRELGGVAVVHRGAPRPVARETATLAVVESLVRSFNHRSHP